MKRILLIAALLYSGFCMAQDPHFSQYYASQMTVNPATAGMFSGDIKLSGLYRQQWPQFGSPFTTGTFAFEFKPNGYKDGQNINRLAFGGMMMYDKSPDEVLKGQYVYGTVAYHKALDAEGFHKLGIGFMAGYNQKMLDASKLTFGSQFNGSGFTPGVGEPISSRKTSSFDVHTGLVYSYETENRLIYAGASVYHLAGPKDYYISGNNVLDYVPRRFNINAGINMRAENGVRFAGSLLAMQQQKVREIMGGGAVGFPFTPDENGVIYVGSWYRVGESLIPTINLQYQNLNLGFSYDSFIGGSNKTITKPKSMEVSIAYRITPYKNPTGCFVF